MLAMRDNRVALRVALLGQLKPALRMCTCMCVYVFTHPQERVNTLVAEAEVRAKVLGQVQGNLSLAEASHRDLTQRLAQRDQELAALKVRD